MAFIYTPQPAIQQAGPLRYLMVAGSAVLVTAGVACAFRVGKHLGASSAATDPDAAFGFFLFWLLVLSLAGLLTAAMA